jgi:hypothetical protein
MLQRNFGKVKIVNPGAHFRCAVEHNRATGRCTVEKLQGGEEYAVNCPACGDTRQRLYVNHMMGVRVAGIVQDRLFTCFNEGISCFPEVVNLLEDMLDGKTFPKIQVEDLPPLTTDQIVYESATAHAQVNPAFATRLDKLDPQHPACAYMVSRGFNPAFLGSYWGCYYAADPNRRLRYAYCRIIIPLLYENVTVGYQARAIPNHTPQQQPKYWTAAGCKKSFFLGGYDYAKNHDFVVVCEGPTKKWRIGSPAVDILGSSLSQGQVNQLLATWKDRTGPIVFVSDPGMEATWQENAAKLVPHITDMRRIVVVHPKTDAGDMAAEDIRGLIANACANQEHPIDINRFYG